LVDQRDDPWIAERRLLELSARPAAHHANVEEDGEVALLGLLAGLIVVVTPLDGRRGLGVGVGRDARQAGGDQDERKRESGAHGIRPFHSFTWLADEPSDNSPASASWSHGCKSGWWPGCDGQAILARRGCRRRGRAGAWRSCAAACGDACA